MPHQGQNPVRPPPWTTYRQEATTSLWSDIAAQSPECCVVKHFLGIFCSLGLCVVYKINNSFIPPQSGQHRDGFST